MSGFRLLLTPLVAISCFEKERRRSESCGTLQSVLDVSASRSAPARDVSQTAESGPGPDLESIAEALIVKGREQGSLTFDDLAQGFLEVLLESNDLARVTAAFTEMGINVIEHESDLEMAAVGDAVSLLTADEEIVRSRRKRCTSYERRAAPPSFAPF